MAVRIISITRRDEKKFQESQKARTKLRQRFSKLQTGRITQSIKSAYDQPQATDVVQKQPEALKPTVRPATSKQKTAQEISISRAGVAYRDIPHSRLEAEQEKQPHTERALQEQIIYPSAQPPTPPSSTRVIQQRIPTQKQDDGIIRGTISEAHPKSFYQEKVIGPLRRTQETGSTFTRSAAAVTETGVAFGAAVITAPYYTAKAGYQFIRDPIGTIGGTYKTVTSPAFRESIASEFKQRPAQSIASVAGFIKAPQIYGKTATALKSGRIKAGAEFVPPEKVFAPEVLKSKSTFPTAQTTAESLAKFEESKGLVTTTAPQKLKGFAAGEGGRAKAGLEDPGIYVTPKGLGSPYFTGVSQVEATQYTLNPFKVASQYFKTPTVTEFKTAGVKLLPREVVAQPGFKAVGEFQKTQAGKGLGFITKRSELGLGTVKPQLYKTPSGKYALEKGTIEIEAVIPKGSEFKYVPRTVPGKIKGFEQYTTYGGELVAIRKAELITTVKATKAPTPTAAKTITGSQIARESSYLSQPKYKLYPSTQSPLSAASFLDGASKTSTKGSYGISRDFVSPMDSRVITSPSKPVAVLSKSTLSSAAPSSTIKTPPGISRELVYYKPGVPSPSYKAKPTPSFSYVTPAKSVTYPKPSVTIKSVPAVQFTPKFTPERTVREFRLSRQEKPRKLTQIKEFKPKIKREFEYAPTLRAAFGKITAPKGKKKKYKLFTGLEARPIF